MTSPTGGLTTDILTASDAVAQVCAIWRVLPVPSIFLTWDWALCWWEVYGYDRHPYLVVVRDTSGRPVSLAPFARVDSHVGPLPAGRLLSWIGGGDVCADFLDIIAPADEHRSAVLEALWQSRGEWDALYFTDLPEDSSTRALMASWAASHRLRFEEREQDECPILNLSADWKTLEAGLSYGFRQHLRRDARRLWESGARVTFCERAEDVDRYMDVLEHLHGERRKQVDKAPGVFARSNFRAFHRRLAPRLLERGWLRLALLDSPPGPLAAYYGFEYRGTSSFYQSGLSRRMPQFSCGQVLVARVMQEAVAVGDREFDFLRGRDAYKSRWTSRSRRTFSIFIAAPSAAGQWAWWTRAARRLIRRS